MPERNRKFPFLPSPCTYYQQLQPLSKYRERSEKACPQGLLPLVLPHIISRAKSVLHRRWEYRSTQWLTATG